MAQPLNPATATRADYNNSYINELPTLIGSGAHPMWKRMFDATIALFKALAEDDAMAVNNTQTFNTPAAKKNAQYFAWDFVMRTASYIARSDPSLASFDESYVDAYTRSILITSLLLDERPGALAQMVEMSYPGHNPGGQPPMSAAVVAAAEDLQSATKENAEAISWMGN